MEDVQLVTGQIHKLVMYIGFFSALIIVMSFGIMMMRFGFGFGSPDKGLATIPDGVYYMDYNVNNLPLTEKNILVKKGFEIFRNTPLHIGSKQKTFPRLTRRQSQRALVGCCMLTHPLIVPVNATTA